MVKLSQVKLFMAKINKNILIVAKLNMVKLSQEKIIMAKLNQDILIMAKLN